MLLARGDNTDSMSLTTTSETMLMKHTSHSRYHSYVTQLLPFWPLSGVLVIVFGEFKQLINVNRY
jgi:hypothetical protein